MLTSAELARALNGSPYLLPDEQQALSLLPEILERAGALEVRCQVLRDNLARQFAEQVARAGRTTEIYESNAIEGKTPTLRETYEILDKHHMWDADAALARYTLLQGFDNEPKVHDVIGLGAARILVDQYIGERDRPVSESDIREMHALILGDHPSAGRYKQYLNRIEGAKHTPVPPSDVPYSMNALVEWMRNSDAPLLWKSAVGHAWLTHIHPFDDGNGRIARLLANYVLGFGCFPPLIIRSSSDRGRYLSALAHSDTAGDILPLVRLFTRVLNRQLNLMEKPDFAWQLFQKDLLVREQSVYQRWRATTARFFDEVAAHLRLANKDLNIVGSLSASDYELLSRGDRSGNAWIARVSAGDKERDLLVWAGHTSSAVDRHLELDHIYPAFFLSEQDPNPKAVKPYRPVVNGREPQHDELSIIADEERAILRRGRRSSWVKLSDAAELFAALLAQDLDHLVDS